MDIPFKNLDVSENVNDIKRFNIEGDFYAKCYKCETENKVSLEDQFEYPALGVSGVESVYFCCEECNSDNECNAFITVSLSLDKPKESKE